MKGQRNISAIQPTGFLQWSRKRYAVFNSLRRVVRIFTLCLAYSILVMPGNIQAQGGSKRIPAPDPETGPGTMDPDDTLKLTAEFRDESLQITADSKNDSLKIQHFLMDGVIVTASRTPVEAQKAARIVTVISKSDIARSPAQTLNDILRNIPGVDIRQRGPLGTQADISIRGGTFDQTLILLNGVNVTDPQTGHHNLNLPVDIESIERIEILNGPAAKSFGPNAFSGVVNIITGNSNPNRIRASLLYGQYGLKGATAGISNTTGKLEQFLSLSRTASDGYIENTDFSNRTLFYQAEYNLKSGTIDLQTGSGSKNFGANNFYSLKYPDQFESVKTEFISLKYRNRSAIRIEPAVYLRRNRDRFELKRDDESFPFNHHKTITTGLNLNTWMVHRFGKTSLGIDLRNEHILSNVLGNPISNPVEVRGFEDSYYLKSYSRFNTSLYAEQTFSPGKFLAAFGVMAHHNHDLSGFRFYPGVDLSFRLNDNMRIFSSANKTLRMPTFTDMFYTSPVQKGNPHLRPEEAVTFEAGIKYTGTTIKGDISAFRRRGYNLIDWIKDPSPDSLTWRSANHAEISFTGVETSLSLTPSEENQDARIQSLRLSYSFLRADAEQGEMLSRYALDYLRHQVNFSVDLRVATRLYSSTTVTWRDRTGSWQNATGDVISHKPFWLADTRFSWKEKHFTGYVEASNILNARYFDFGGLIQPGIWVRGGITLNLEYSKKKSDTV